MKKIIFSVILLSAIGYFVACNKTPQSTPSCNGVDPAQESDQLIHFAADSITVTKDTTGVYFQILDSGSGVSPVGTSNLVVSYTAMRMDKTIFDSASNSNLGGLQLYQLIPGWQIGLPKIKKGGHIKLLIPSAYAWGCTGSGTTIPPNSPVYFDIYLIDVI
ncbi:MAG TPA: FKBP-type peptidyl-prolyl cis-trans isomerase [Puia sp.]|jgi:FKBP-type peptidyl-prolyl cis-trans isomerase FkpA